MQDFSHTHEEELSDQVSSMLQHKYCCKSTFSTACRLPHRSIYVRRQEMAWFVQLTGMKLVGTLQPGTIDHVDSSALQVSLLSYLSLCTNLGNQLP